METIHDIIELLELYPETFERIEVCQSLSSNPNITYNYVVSHCKANWEGDLNSLYWNPSVTTPHTVEKLLQLKFKNLTPGSLLLLCNSAFDEEEVYKIITKYHRISDDQVVNVNYYLGFNKSITPYFQYLKNNRWEWYDFASNEHFMPLVYAYLRLYRKPYSTLQIRENQFIMNKAFTVEMFFDLFGWNNDLYDRNDLYDLYDRNNRYDRNDLQLQLLYITNNPNVLATDLHSFLPSVSKQYCANINVNPSQLYDNDCLHIAKNPRLHVEELENLLKEHALTRKCNAFCDYSKNSNATWEIVNDYSWCSWNWKNIAKNAFSSYSLYRSATLLNELFELNIVYDYPLLAKTW